MSVLSMLRSHREAKSSDVHDLARRVASGETVDPDRIIEAVSAAGMDDEDFCDLVDLIERRKKLRETASKGAEADRARAPLQEAIAKVDAAWAAAEEKYLEQRFPLESKLADAVAVSQAASTATNELMQDRNLPSHLQVARREARERLHNASRAVSEMEDTLRGIERDVKHAKDALTEEPKLTNMNRPTAEKILESADYRIGNVRQEIERLSRTRDEAQAAFDAIEQQCLNF